MLFQVSKGTTNSAQSLLLHRFREAYGRDRRVSSGQVTRLISILFLYFYIDFCILLLYIISYYR